MYKRQRKVSASEFAEAIEGLANHLADFSINEQDYSVLLLGFGAVAGIDVDDVHRLRVFDNQVGPAAEPIENELAAQNRIEGNNDLEELHAHAHCRLAGVIHKQSHQLPAQKEKQCDKRRDDPGAHSRRGPGALPDALHLACPDILGSIAGEPIGKSGNRRCV